jgi:hypothetical protein
MEYSVLQFKILKGRSFIYHINNNGPGIEPWGTPYFTGHLSERAFPICTWDNISDIQDKILKVNAPFIVSPLTYMFNRIIDSSIYPNI